MQSCEASLMLESNCSNSLAFSCSPTWTCIATHGQNQINNRTPSSAIKTDHVRTTKRASVRLGRSPIRYTESSSPTKTSQHSSTHNDDKQNFDETTIDITRGLNLVNHFMDTQSIVTTSITKIPANKSSAKRRKRQTSVKPKQDNNQKHFQSDSNEIISKSAVQTKKQSSQIETNQKKSQTLTREDAQKLFLEQQLNERQKENEQKKAKTITRSLKTKKRVRSTSTTHFSSPRGKTMKDTFQAYMDEISRDDLLDQSQVISLASQIKLGLTVETTQKTLEQNLGRRPSIPEIATQLGIDVGDVQSRRMAGIAAKNSLVAANLRLVTSVARKVASSKGAHTVGIALDDMVQEGSVGLLRAAEKFDASRGYMFSTYATWWIRAYIMRSITTQSRSIKVPSTIVDEYARIKKEYSRLTKQIQFPPTDEAVARSLGITTAKLHFVVNVVTRVPTSLDISLGHPGGSSNARSLGEIIEGDDQIEQRLVENMEKKELDAALKKCLRPLERAVIRLRFGLDDGQPRTLRETGELLGLSKERIRQVVFRALPKMKTPEIQKMLQSATAR